MRYGILCGICLCLSLFISSAQAQPIPFTGPLLALNNATQEDIILHDLGTGQQRSLRFGAANHMAWGFTADGCRLIYTLSEGVFPSRLYSAGIDGSDPRELVQFDELPPTDWSIWEPQIAPDGSRIAFTFIRRVIRSDGTPGFTYHIGWVIPEGGTPNFYSVTGDEHEPEWSVDSQWLAYISYTERVPGADMLSTAVPTPEGQTSDPGTLLRESDIWVVSYDGETKYRLTAFPVGSIRRPRWSPDGVLMSFIFAPSGNNDVFFLIGTSEGSQPTQLSFNWSQILDVTWLPDSSALLGVARDLQSIPASTLWQIPLVGAADTDAQAYSSDPLIQGVDYPRFSPDGRWLAVRTEYALAVQDRAAGSWTLLDVPLSNTPPIWSPLGFTGEEACS